MHFFSYSISTCLESQIFLREGEEKNKEYKNLNSYIESKFYILIDFFCIL